MIKRTAVLGLFLLFASIAPQSVFAELQMLTEEMRSCGEAVSYDFVLENEGISQWAFDLSAEADTEGIWVSLEPSQVLIPGGASQEMAVFARPESYIAPGAYTIFVSAQCERCGDHFTSTALLIVPADCPREETDDATNGSDSGPETEDGSDSGPETEDSPTGASSSAFDTTVITGLFIALGAFVAMLYKIRRETPKNG